MKRNSGNSHSDSEIPDVFTSSLDANVKIIKEIFKNDDTVVYRFFESRETDWRFCAVYIQGMVDNKILNLNIINPVMEKIRKEDLKAEDTIALLAEKILNAAETKNISDICSSVSYLLYGHTMLLADGCNQAILINSQGWEARKVDEPLSETVIKGSREGFTESLMTNLTLIRRRIQTKDLKFKLREIGERTRTKICICYIDGIARPEILAELERRLDKICIDGILDTQYIEEFIEDEPLSPFNTIGYTERPDVVAGKLLEGRIALICDGTSNALTLPFIFLEHFQANEDYYSNFFFASINRLIRTAGFFITTSIPAIYVAIVTYHQEMVPTPLMLSIYNAREGVPFPTIIEAMLMLFFFEVLREAGVRLPKYIGQAISIVGALVLGDAAVNANFVSAPMVIVTAITGISSFLLPLMSGALIVVRFVLLLLSSVLGLYGYIFGVIGLLLHFAAMKSFGIPYMLNTTISQAEDIQDMTVRVPWWYMKFRPKKIAQDSRRQAKGNSVKKG